MAPKWSETAQDGQDGPRWQCERSERVGRSRCLRCEHEQLPLVRARAAVFGAGKGSAGQVLRCGKGSIFSVRARSSALGVVKVSAGRVKRFRCRKGQLPSVRERAGAVGAGRVRCRAVKVS